MTVSGFIEVVSLHFVDCITRRFTDLSVTTTRVTLIWILIYHLFLNITTSSVCQLHDKAKCFYCNDRQLFGENNMKVFAKKSRLNLFDPFEFVNLIILFSDKLVFQRLLVSPNMRSTSLQDYHSNKLDPDAPYRSHCILGSEIFKVFLYIWAWLSVLYMFIVIVICV